MGDLEALRRRAGSLGIETSYRDVSGRHHDAAPSTLEHIIDVLEADIEPVSRWRRLEPLAVAGGRPIPVGDGVAEAVVHLVDGTELRLGVANGSVTLPIDVPFGCHELRISGVGIDESTTLVVAPRTMPRSAELAGGSGVFVPAYALWEPSDAGPSFANLASLAAMLPASGIDVLSTLPLYASFLDDPFDPSPYAPMSRLHWNEVYVDIDGDVEIDGGEPAANACPVDWRAVAQERRRQLLAATGRGDAATAEVTAFVAGRPDVADYARFRAARPDSIDAAQPAALVHASHELAQYLADRQLAAVERSGGAVLALDLPIGSHTDGYETWAHPEWFAKGVTVGAPPDEFFAGGQDWGFPPALPASGRRSGHRSWRDVVARAAEHATLLRIDHVMGVHRLWWIPDGAPADEGCYVRYPGDEILAVIAAEAAAAGTTIVGEDLGTVPGEVVDALARWDVLGMYEEMFHLDTSALTPIPARTVAGIRTHDMAPFAVSVAAGGGATGFDIAGRCRLLAAALGRHVAVSPDGLLDATLERLAHSRAYLVVVDLDDLLGETVPHNVPGQVLASSWRRRLAQPTAETLTRPDVCRRLALIANRSSTT